MNVTLLEIIVTLISILLVVLILCNGSVRHKRVPRIIMIVTIATIYIIAGALYCSFKDTENSESTLSNGSYSFNVYESNWLKLDDTEHIYNTFRNNFKYDLYANNDGMFVIEYGNNGDVDLEDMARLQAEQVGKPIDSDEYKVVKEETNDSITYSSEDGEIYTKAIKDKNNNIVCITMITGNLNDNEMYEQSLKSISISSVNNDKELDIKTLADYVK